MSQESKCEDQILNDYMDHFENNNINSQPCSSYSTQDTFNSCAGWNSQTSCSYYTNDDQDDNTCSQNQWNSQSTWSSVDEKDENNSNSQNSNSQSF